MSDIEELAKETIGSAIRVHSRFGPGLLESVYTLCTAQDLIESGFRVEIHKPIPLTYKHLTVERGYQLDLLVEDALIVEVKCVEAIAPIHVAQVLTYLRLRKAPLGLILNFNVLRMKDGIRRVVNNHVGEDGQRR